MKKTIISMALLALIGAAKTTPAEGSSRHAPMVREATTCFICTLLCRPMRIGKSALRDSSEFQHIY
jgi:hypothetical protein